VILTGNHLIITHSTSAAPKVIHLQLPITAMQIIGHKKLALVDSTQLVAKSEILKLSPQKWYMWSAQGQTRGYGRRGRCWFSPMHSNMYVTYGFCLKKSTNIELSCISQTAGYCVIETLEQLGINDTAFKWPNDVLVNQKKISGALVEVIQYDSETHAILLGVGININSNEKELSIIDQPATSISIVTEKKYEIFEIIDIFSKHLRHNVEELILKGFGGINAKINNKLHTFKGETVVLQNECNYYSGKVESIGMKGELLLSDCKEKAHYNGTILKGEALKKYLLSPAS
jgi:BirA family transcriptional regulator, biotin operon repressor / biotin---[acetyl-CoA-carboxylase] ligase